MCSSSWYIFLLQTGCRSSRMVSETKTHGYLHHICFHFPIIIPYITCTNAQSCIYIHISIATMTFFYCRLDANFSQWYVRVQPMDICTIPIQSFSPPLSHNNVPYIILYLFVCIHYIEILGIQPYPSSMLT